MLELNTSATAIILSAVELPKIMTAYKEYANCRSHSYDTVVYLSSYLKIFADKEFTTLCQICSDIDQDVLSMGIYYGINGGLV